MWHQTFFPTVNYPQWMMIHRFLHSVTNYAVTENNTFANVQFSVVVTLCVAHQSISSKKKLGNIMTCLGTGLTNDSFMRILRKDWLILIMFCVSPTNTHILVTVSKGFHTPNLGRIGVPDAHTMPQPGSPTPTIYLFCPPFRSRAPPSLRFTTRGYSRVAGWRSRKTAPDCCFISSFPLRLPEIAGLTSRYHIAQRWTP